MVIEKLSVDYDSVGVKIELVGDMIYIYLKRTFQEVILNFYTICSSFFTICSFQERGKDRVE